MNENEKERIMEVAQMMNNSTLLKSYELMMGQFEGEMEKKNTLIKDMERELQQIQYENSHLASQLYKVKAQMQDGKQEAVGMGGRDEKEQLVELLKRNHDIVVEKYELQKQRNDGLEKVAIDKERLYHEIKTENDNLANQNYKLARSNEDLLNEKRILDSKLKNLD